jgi:hypothetical protein
MGRICYALIPGDGDDDGCVDAGGLGCCENRDKKREGWKMRGQLYRRAAAIGESGERVKIRAPVMLGLWIRDKALNMAVKTLQEAKYGGTEAGHQQN